MNQIRQWPSKDVELAVGRYVYALQDPRSGVLFYIGKGTGQRVFQHALEAKELAEDTDADRDIAVSQKIGLIKEIHHAGLEPVMWIIRHGLPTGSGKYDADRAAFDIEAALLDFARLAVQSLGADKIALTNIAGGHHNTRLGLMRPDVIVALYNPRAAVPIEVPALAFQVSKTWSKDISDDRLYDATRGWWNVGSGKRATAQYAFAVSHGVIRAVYRIDPGSWRTRREGDRGWESGENANARWGFEGTPALDMADYVGRFIAADEMNKHTVQYSSINCG